MSYRHIQEEQRERCRILTLVNPGKKNAFHAEMRDELNLALDRAFAEVDVKAVILTGAEGDFCSGADLTRLAAADPSKDAVRSRMASMHALVRRITGGPKPIIAAIEGVAAGAGLSLAIAADVVVADPGARFVAAFARVGLFPDMGILQTLPNRVGLPLARRLLMEGRTVSAEEAVRTGLADQLATSGRALDEALAVARGFENAAPLTVRAVKNALAAGVPDLETVLALEGDAVPRLASSEDHLAARTAFLNKAPVVFQGR